MRRLDHLELAVDERLRDLRGLLFEMDANPALVFDAKIVAGMMRAAYARGYQDALGDYEAGRETIVDFYRRVGDES